MSATFNPALALARDRMRLTLGDTNVNATKADGADPMTLPVDDAVYDGIFAYQGNDERLATLQLAEALITRYAQEATRAELTGVESAEWKDRLTAWRELAKRLRAELADEAAAVASGFRVLLPQRARDQARAEYYAGGRCPPEDWA